MGRTVKMNKLAILTEELIIANADYDQNPTDEKLDYIAKLEKKIMEILI